MESTTETLSSVLSKARFRDVHKEDRLNERQRKIVNMAYPVPEPHRISRQWRKGWNQAGLTERQRRKTSLTAFDADS